MSKKLKKAMAICAVLLFGAMNLSPINDQPQIMRVETVKVRAGDTFWDIAEHYRNLDGRNLYIFEYMDEIRELNPWLKDRQNQLQPNDVITVKYVSQNRER